MKILVVGGNFDNDFGSSSSVINKIFDALKQEFSKKGFKDVQLLNGGSMNQLKSIDFKSLDVLFWAPNISNDEEKIIPDIKSVNQKLFLISSKRVVEKEYKPSDVVGRLLKTKSNLGIMITKDNLYNFQLLDPLGNSYCNSQKIEVLANSIVDRVLFVKNLSRIGSKKVGNKRDFEINEKFLEFVRYSGEEFTKYVNAINPNRLLGNASTRCMFGFPAEKQNERIFVTQRNVDKALIETQGFVEVTTSEDCVKYFGDKKPSVDTPIQVRLFNYYRNINYMVHGHVYIENAKMTENKIPCGYVEEFEEIKELFPNRDEKIILVNLRGHGCLLMSESVDDLWKLGHYCSREFPES